MSKKLVFSVVAIIITLLLGVSVGMIWGRSQSSHSMDNSHMMSDGTKMDNDHMMRMEHGAVELNNSKQKERQLAIPTMLQPDKDTGKDITYTVVANKGEMNFKDGKKTKTLGYNGNFLGPVLKIKKGQTVHIKTENQLSEETSFHWHGLVLPSSADGGPHQPIQSGKTKQVDFTVNQEAATLWFHPHPMGKTAKQVYEGLAGLLYVEDDKQLDIPKNYGKDDIPVIVQDRKLNENNQFDYENDLNPDGTTGNTLLINGTINPYFNVTSEKIRLRLVNGSNARNYNFTLDDHSDFTQIATDGGFLEKPVSLKKLPLSPGERAEIVVDTSKYKKGSQVRLMDGNITILLLKMADREKSNPLPSKLNQINSPLKGIENIHVEKIEIAGMGHMVTIDGKTFDMNRIDKNIKQGKEEVWEIYNAPDMMGDMIHPFHIHGVQFQIISRNGKIPSANEQGWKDTVAIHPKETVKLRAEFKEKGVFMYHCHILEHEENGMMGQFEVE